MRKLRQFLIIYDKINFMRMVIYNYKIFYSYLNLEINLCKTVVAIKHEIFLF